MYARTAFGILNKIKSERKRDKLNGRVKRKDSLADIVRLLNKENISRPLSLRVQEKIVELRNSSKKLDSVLANRERSLENLTRGYIKESLVLREELFRLRKIEGYKPADYVFQFFGNLDPRTEGLVNSEKNNIIFDHINLSNEESERLKPLNEIYDALKASKLDFVRKKARTISELGNKASILEMSQDGFQKRAKFYRKKLHFVSVREGKNVNEEKRLEDMERYLVERNDDLKKKKEEVKILKREFETNMSYRKHLHRKEHSETSFILRRKLNELDTILQDHQAEHIKVTKRIEREKGDLEEVLDLQQSLHAKKEELTHQIKKSKLELDWERRHRLKRKNKLVDRKAKKKKKKKEEERRNEKKKKKAKFLKQSTIPEIDVQLSLDIELSEEDEADKKDIQEVATEVTNFKKEFKSLFSQFDVVKQRMKFYDSAGTNSLNNPTSIGSGRVQVTDGPKGRVALVMTDVQSSTHLWERDINVMRSSMQLHNDLARKLIGENDGYEIRTEGDAFIVAFPRVSLAIRFALSFQSELIKVPWPEGLYGDPATAIENDEKKKIVFKGLRVRIGIHVGDPIIEKDSLTGRDDYYGPMAIKAGLIEGQGRGGIIAISEDVYNSIKNCFGTDNDREIQQKRLGDQVLMKMLGYKKLKGLKRREVIRWLVPHRLRSRFKMVGPTNPHDFRKMNTIMNKLNLRKKELDTKRTEIRNRLNFQIRMKALESSNNEKENIISYLRKRLTNLKGTYERALEGRKNPFLEEETKIKNELSAVTKKYHYMNEVYDGLKRNFVDVETVFKNRLRGELDRFQNEMDEVTNKLSINENRSRFNRKVWGIEKEVLVRRGKEVEKNVLERESEINKLKNELERAIKKKEDFFKNGASQISDSNIVEDEDDEEFESMKRQQEKEEEEEEELKKTKQFEELLAVVGDGKKKYEEEEEGEFRVSDEVVSINGMNGISPYRKKMKKIPYKEDHILPFLGQDEMITGNTRLISVMSRSRHDHMADVDILQLKRLKKASFSVHMFTKLRSEWSRQNNKFIPRFFDGCSEDNRNKNNNNSSTRDLHYFEISKKLRKRWVSERVEEIRRKYRKLEQSEKWNGSALKMELIKEMLKEIQSHLGGFASTGYESPSTPRIPRRMIDRPRSSIVQRRSRKWGDGDSNIIKNKKKNKQQQIQFGKKKIEKNNSSISSYESRKKRVVLVPRKLESSQVSYSRLLQSLPNVIVGIRKKSESSSEKKGILNRLYYDRNARKYSNILPRIN